jgi:serine/threonine protein kinase/Leucine-rich repeat (LRR) protein
MPQAAEPVSEARAEEVFNGAVALPESERAAFLAVECYGDERLRQRVQVLLDADADDSDLLDVPPLTPEIEVELARLKPEESGEMIGPYKLLEPLGEGGFGTVWLAEQEIPVKRRVALKIIKMGMDTRDVIARFQQEEQALAMMEHPNIAKVLDAGATQFGRPFFVMELVNGIPITKYCDQHKLPTNERLRLFIAVCNALQHAHHKGIIHRDLKPSNILVALHDGGPVPKVIDFGVAKATQQRLTEMTVFTQFEQMIGTPLYMSPEQAEMSGLDVDTRSDIYSLGVLLYELLTGRTPFDAEELMKRGYAEIRRMIREVEPPKPSTALSTMARDAAATIAGHQQLAPPKLVGLLRGDLDWIVMKALEKDRTRRYETANGFALDIERHLAGEPILARPPTAFYRLDRLVRRNKLAFAAAVCVLLALVAGAAFSLWQAREAEREAQRAAEALDDLRETAPAFAAQAHAMAAREEFAEALEKLDTAAKLRPDVAEYRVAHGDILQCLLRLAEAAAEYRAALQISPEHPRAKANVALCDRLLAANADPTKLAPESLRELADAMEREHRPAAQRLAVARRLGEEKKVLRDYWTERLADLPLPPERPLAERLTLRGDGLLALDLQGTRLTDLAPLEGAPLGEINATGCADIKDLRPLSALPLTALFLARSGVTDLAPLSGVRTLQRLDLSETAVSDFAALRGLPLQTLIINYTTVTDLSPLAGMPLKRFQATNLATTDCSPLAGCPLETCVLNGTKVTDLGFLKNAPLRKLDLTDSRDARNFAALAGCQTLESIKLPATALDLPVADLDAITALRGLPALREIVAGHFADAGSTKNGRPGLLGINTKDLSDSEARKLGLPNAKGTSVTGVTAGSAAEKAGIKPGDFIREVNGAPFPKGTDLGERIRNAGANAAIALSVWRDGTTLTTHATLGEAGGNVVAGRDPLSAPTTAEFWKKWDLLITVARPLRAADFTVSARVLEDGTLEVDLYKQPIRDISILEGAPISRLAIASTKVSDLRPLRTMKLTSLDLWDTPVSDLSPLRGLPLTSINLGATNVTDLSPLEGMPLTTFYADRAPFTDYAPLAQCPTLKIMQLPRPMPGAPPLNLEPLRSLPNLERISFQFEWATGPVCTAKDFWAHWDGLGWMRALQDGEFRFAAQQLADGRWKVELHHETRFSDCSIFKGAHLAHLNVENTGVADLSPLRDIPLELLDTGRTQVTDVSTLRGSTLARSLKVFSLYDTRVADFSPVAECVNLTEFNACRTSLQDIGFLRELKACTVVAFTNTNVTDISVLSEMPQLKTIFPPWAAREVGQLRQLPNLRRISYDYEGGKDQTAEQFWQMHDEVPCVAALRALGINAAVERREDGLWEVNLEKQPITDLSPLRGSRIYFLNIMNTPVADLSPLRGMPLTTLHMGGSKVTDLSPLAGMKLGSLQMASLQVKDISVVRGMPLTNIYMGGGYPADLAPLANITSLISVQIPVGAPNVELLRNLPNAKRLGYGWDGVNQRIDTSVEEFWQRHDELPWFAKLAAEGIIAKVIRRDDGLWRVDFHSHPITDLAPLRGSRIGYLDLGRSPVTDLTPLRGLPLDVLALSGTKVTDLAPIAGMKLTLLNLSRTTVKDISVVRGMPLREIYLGDGVPVDLAPLHEIDTLEVVNLTRGSTNIEGLRRLPKVKVISYDWDGQRNRFRTNAAEFWAEYDREKKR